VANAVRLTQLLEYITQNPSEWDQDVWAERSVCGTAFCAAGTAINLFTYAQFNWMPAVTIGGPSFAETVTDTDDVEYMIDDYARVVLELTDEQGELFFNPDNDLHDLWRLASEFTEGVVQVPADHARLVKV
jgi:hypothetical protein